MLLRYIQALTPQTAQMAQMAARKRHHTLGECCAAVRNERERLVRDVPTTRPFPMGPWARAGIEARNATLGFDSGCLAAA
jgi:hypothetical protein